MFVSFLFVIFIIAHFLRTRLYSCILSFSNSNAANIKNKSKVPTFVSVTFDSLQIHAALWLFIFEFQAICTMDVDLLRPGTVPMAPETILWFEFLLDKDLLLKHLQKLNPGRGYVYKTPKFTNFKLFQSRLQRI